MTTHQTDDIVIAGAGLGGLTAALVLHDYGIRATVLEAAEEIRPLGVGINIQPAAVTELLTLGLGDALARTGIRTAEHRYLDHLGTVLWTEARGMAGGHVSPQYSIHRGELQMLLVEAVRDRLGPDAIRTGVRVRGFEETDGGVRVHATASGSPATYEGAALIGADGIHSVVRAQLHPDGPALSGGRAHMWRGLTELDGFLDGHTMIVASDDTGARMIAYPVSAQHAARGQALVNWVCLVPTEPEPGEVSAWNRPGRLEDILPHFAHWKFGWIDIPALLAGGGPILHYPMVDRDPLKQWGTGRVTLLGDAAHPMYPIGANGGSQAILDAVTLATELFERDEVTAALRRYEEIRRPRTAEIVRANRTMDRAERDLAARPEQDKSGALETITSSYRASVEHRHPVA
ncbi:flavin-dependent oxidoreductase [Streptomyces montanus]|uniref:Flavin-dependent oxidoreductase n=1 Tax=Streptomyces montanus TaxID=2580423 RepID=A0A5R9FIW6_9ACTN|nr:flavin-dependent oxidoreductase [Streptomyces montanus]TLS43777.1 flavin-dependent oxidoreductase [Streptomyces montanus]